MKKLMLGLLMLTGVVAGTASAQQIIVVPNPTPIVVVQPRPCYYAVVPVTTYQLVLTAFGYVYQPVTTYQYQLVCY